MKKNILVGLHTLWHDGSICTYDIKTKEFKYLKFERITGIKKQFHQDLTSWVKYLNYLDYNLEDVTNIFLVNCWSILNVLQTIPLDYQKNIVLVDHHTSHHYSLLGNNSIVFDDVGSQDETLSVFKKNKVVDKLYRNHNEGLGRTLNFLWRDWFKKDRFRSGDYAGHCMALAGFGKDYSNQIIRQNFDKYEESFKFFLEKNYNKSYEENCNNYVSSLHFYWFKRIKNILKKYFNKDSYFEGSGGAGENIILNTLLKKEYPNFNATPHCGDEGTSIGALRYGLKHYLNIPSKIDYKKTHQWDENFKYAKEKTIKQVAKFLHEGKLVMWGQGWGEVGPRALGFRSILMNPCTPNAKEIINNKIKKRIWFRPYGASVPSDDYQKYFDLNYESPWMLYQAIVKDPVKFKNITHVDGTCRIQTVDSHNPSFLKLLKEFEKISGYSVLINTSMNLPGKPIVGTKKQAKIMFENSQADILVMGDEIYIK